MQKLVDCGEALGTARRHASYVQQVLETTMAAEASGGGQAPRAQERASLLADARAALTWVYANDDGADLRVPLAGGLRQIVCRTQSAERGTSLVQSGARGPR